ncbi:hypothetical protein TWF225_004563 [Orbilia oligospora]|uniref:Peptidase S8/S53 domain-containing protein n=1 Tax=Orbilia oligospora TaxID=2813651 RepID=A0A8H2E7A2_ORBOL|nr:hypothetical protein TWF225_004563 [Orbilia oligospora]KAF3248880.1 hypothetical protein TWF128_007961 [Orbilia oligospora]KAF3272536.1 hypothetical protein TWF217_000028 [Orbilia oligospora]TGJ73780.1 hypothetical protein EYR41_000855 [Orbilia oligospora]
MARSHQIKVVSFFSLILLGLFFLADFAASERTIPRGELKIGTLEKHFKQVTIAIKAKYRRKPRDIDRLIQEFKKHAIPPREKSIYKITSEHLGTWVVAVDIFPDQDRWEGLIPQEITELMEAVIEESGGFSVQGDPAPAWLSPLADALSDDEWERMQMGLGNANKKNKRGPGTEDKKKPISKARVGDDLSQADIEPVGSDSIENIIISQPPDTPIKKMNGIAYREREAGSGVVVYVMDSGLDFSHKHFDNYRNQFTSPSSLNWLYAGPMPSDERSDDGRPFMGFGDDEPARKIFYTGTVTASKIIGETGIAPSADLVAVKLQTGRNSYSFTSVLDCLLKIFDHFKLLKELDRDNELNYKGAVIIAGSGSNQQGYDEQVLAGFSKLIIEILFQLGNLNAYTFFSGLPGKETTARFPRTNIAVMKFAPRTKGFLEKTSFVGSTDAKGKIHTNRGILRPRFFAPGTVSAPWLYDHYRGNEKKLPYISQTTTRYASAMAAGVCAALISRGWEDPLQRMEELSYRRKDGSDYPKLIWNGINRSAWPKAL